MRNVQNVNHYVNMRSSHIVDFIRHMDFKILNNVCERQTINNTSSAVAMQRPEEEMCSLIAAGKDVSYCLATTQ
jgi:hypothetical protein